MLKDIALVVNYARDLGIRVVPEFDTPGHTKSWGKGQPDLLTNCISSGVSERNYGPINPSNEANFEFLKNLFQEISKLFPDFYLHLGGDEDMNGNYKKLEGFYMKRLIDIVNNLKTKKGYSSREEIFANGNEIPQNTIVQIWKENFSDEKATSAGHRVIISFCWYLDLVTYGDDWFYKFYNCDPHQYVETQQHIFLVY
ncbi:Beta-hexosaminidase subunit beta [Armadillidium vulgare]|nr:Beta-hexosaminidase subunit beta [Armadillidium vulgare]